MMVFLADVLNTAANAGVINFARIPRPAILRPKAGPHSRVLSRGQSVVYLRSQSRQSLHRFSNVQRRCDVLHHHPNETELNAHVGIHMIQNDVRRNLAMWMWGIGQDSNVIRRRSQIVQLRTGPDGLIIAN